MVDRQLLGYILADYLYVPTGKNSQQQLSFLGQFRQQ